MTQLRRIALVGAVYIAAGFAGIALFKVMEAHAIARDGPDARAAFWAELRSRC